jgi:hypothetical protein
MGSFPNSRLQKYREHHMKQIKEEYAAFAPVEVAAPHDSTASSQRTGDCSPRMPATIVHLVVLEGSADLMKIGKTTTILEEGDEIPSPEQRANTTQQSQLSHRQHSTAVAAMSGFSLDDEAISLSGEDMVLISPSSNLSLEEASSAARVLSHSGSLSGELVAVFEHGHASGREEEAAPMVRVKSAEQPKRSTHIAATTSAKPFPHHRGVGHP